MKLNGVLGLVAACIVLALTGCRGEREATKKSAAASTTKGRPVIFVGLDGADWQLLDLLIADGSMPNLARLVNEGSSGVLLTQHPPLSPLLWTTMFTGAGPLEHRILDFTRIAKDGNREPITSDDRAVPAIWNMASGARKKVVVVGPWASWPAEEVNGVVVSDALFAFHWSAGTPVARVVYPATREAMARETVERAKTSVDVARLREFVPTLDPRQLDSIRVLKRPLEHPVGSLERLVAETGAYHDITMRLLREERPDLTIVYFEGTDVIGHVFAPFSPPRPPSVSQKEFDTYMDVPRRYFMWIDTILGDYMAIARETGAVLFIASDHGFEWGAGRPEHVSSAAAATAARWHRQEGMYLLWGSGIDRSDGHALRGSIARVSPTLLELLGMPPGRRMEPPLPPVQTSKMDPVDYRRDWKPSVPAATPSRAGSDEEIAKLEALGYLGGGERTSFDPSNSGRSPGSFNNEGLILREKGKSDDARRAFESAIRLDPGSASALWNLSDLLHARGQLDKSDELLEQAVAAGLPDGGRQVVARAVGYEQAGEVRRAGALLERAVTSMPSDPDLRLGRGKHRMQFANDCRGAIADLKEVVRLEPGDAIAHATLGLAYFCAGDQVSARKSLERSLALDPNQPEVKKVVGE